MDEIYNWIKNIVIYMILNTIIMNLLGNSNYKKYVSVVSGMILVLIVVSPLINVTNLEDNLDYFIMSNDFAIETSNFQNDLSQMEELQNDAVFTEYKEKLKNQVEKMLLEEDIYLVSFDLTFDRDVGNTTFGEILGMNLTVALDNEEKNMDKKSSFEEIEISKIEIIGAGDKTSEKLPSPMEINIKNKLSDFYYIEPDNINISIQGG